MSVVTHQAFTRLRVLVMSNPPMGHGAKGRVGLAWRSRDALLAKSDARSTRVVPTVAGTSGGRCGWLGTMSESPHPLASVDDAQMALFRCWKGMADGTPTHNQ